MSENNEMFSGEEKNNLSELFEKLAKEIKENPKKSILEIDFPTQINGIINKPFTINDDDSLSGAKCGDLVSVRYDGETYLGIFLGNLPIKIISYLDVNKNEIVNLPHNNPAMFVPKLKRIIFGIESWWSKIKSEEDFKKITDEDIENTWYVKLLNEMVKKKINNYGI